MILQILASSAPPRPLNVASGQCADVSAAGIRPGREAHPLTKNAGTVRDRPGSDAFTRERRHRVTGSRDREGTVRSLRKRDHRLAVPALWSFFSDCPENKGACGLVAFVFRSRRDQPLQIGIATSTSPSSIQVSLLGHICFECHTPDQVQTFSALRPLFPRPWATSCRLVPTGNQRRIRRFSFAQSRSGCGAGSSCPSVGRSTRGPRQTMFKPRHRQKGSLR